jgi:hypothetical protein
MLALAHDDLYNHYKMNFALMQHHKYGLEDIENMIPFEREVYVSLLRNYLEEELQKQKRKG